MSSQTNGKGKHNRGQLPLLLNPMLNHLFNNPMIQDNQKLNNIVKRICRSPGDFAILLPDTKFIMLNTDIDTGQSYKDLCFDSEFIESHIILATQKHTPDLKSTKNFQTLNGKHININRDIVSSVKGFRNDFKLKIIGQYFFKNFAPYISFGVNFHVIVIEEALIGNPREKGLKQFEIDVDPKVDTDSDLILNENGEVLIKKPFDDLARELPDLSTLMGPQFKLLFQRFNVKNTSSERELNEVFMGIMSMGSSIVNALPDDVFNSIKTQFPNVDLHESIYSYIELNIYDKFWAQYLSITDRGLDDILNESYGTIQHLSINQVGLPKSILMKPDKLAMFEKRVLLAIEEFQKLEFTNQSSAKVDVLVQTFKLLTTSQGADDPNDFSVDADTLISLFVLVVSSAKVKNLNAHLSYIKEYSFSQDYIETGFAGYVISSYEATLNYLNDPENLSHLLKYASQNDELWNLIKSVSMDFNENNQENDSTDDDLYIKKIVTLLQPFKDGNIPIDSFIRSRTLQGESCLMLSVLRNNKNLFRSIAAFEYIFTLDDILEDRNINGLNLLNAALQIKNTEVIDELADIVLQAEQAEIEDYCNKKDIHDRNLGHFLFHRSELIPRFGPYVNWIEQDTTGQTPLCAIVRCYDHSNYHELVKTAVDTVAEWYKTKNKEFNYKDHIDNKGSTLIHMINDGEALKYFLEKFETLDLNAINKNYQTPLTQFIRYNRLSNIKTILKDDRLIIDKCEPRYFLSALDYIKLDKIKPRSNSDASTGRTPENVNKEIMELVDSTYVERICPKIDGKIFGIARLKFDINHEICLYIKSFNQDDEGGWSLTIHSKKDFIKVLKLIKMESPNTFLNTNEEWFPGSFEIGDRPSINYSNKLKVNKQMTDLEIVLTSLMFNEGLKNNKLLIDFLTIQRPLNEMKEVQRINSQHEAEKDKLVVSKGQQLSEKMGKVIFLTPEEIGNYKTFLKYSVNEMNSTNSLLERFYKILVVEDIKEQDLKYTLDNFLYFIAGSLKASHVSENINLINATESLKSLHQLYVDLKEVDDPEIQERLIESVKLLRNSTTELINMINKFLELKINKWWNAYFEIKRIKDELIKVLKIEKTAKQDKISTVTTNIERCVVEIGKLIGDIELDSMVVNDLAQDNSIGQIDTSGLSADSEISTSYFIGLIEKRRYSYVSKLIEDYGRNRKVFLELNIDIRIGYESLCVEISNFYLFKRKFIKFMMKSYMRDKLRVFKLQKGFMVNGLAKYKEKNN